jgi:HK97 family phage major capsid protein
MSATADRQIRDQLKGIRDQLADLRERRAEAKRERDAAKEAFAGASFEKGSKITDSPEFKAAEQAVKKVGDLDDEIESHRESESSLLKLLGDSADSNGNGNGTVGSHEHPITLPARGSWNAHDLLRNSDVYQEARDRGTFRSTGKFGTLPIGQLASREEVASFLQNRALAAELPAAPAGPVTSGDLAGAIRPDWRGIQPFRLPTLLDIFPTGTTDSNLIEYVQVIAIPGGADVVEEGAIKPESGLKLQDESSPVVTIAGWIKVNRNAMDDLSGLAAMINTLLPYDVRRKVIGQVIAGDGTGGNLRGIYETTGVGEPEAVAGDNLADAFLRAMTTVILSDSEPNFAALNPLTWQDLLLMKNANGNYIYGAPGSLPGGMVGQTVWGLTLTTNRMIPQDKPLVGDSMGAMILVREGVNVKTSDSDQDDFVRNRVTILAETRVAFVVWRPSAFAIVNLGDGGSGDE